MKVNSKTLNEYQVVVQRLKKRLREEKLTYREVAQGIHMSESGLKKVLAAKDGSFQRLTDICKFAGLDMGSLLSDRNMTNVGLNDRQQEALLKDARLFKVYWSLVYERRSQEEIVGLFGLSPKDLFKSLRALDGLSLIRLMPGGRVRLPPIRAIRWSGDGPLVRKIYVEWSRKVIDANAHPDAAFFLLRSLRMSKKTFTDLIAAQRVLENEFVHRAVHEMQTLPLHSLEHIRWVGAIDRGSFIAETTAIADDGKAKK